MRPASWRAGHAGGAHSANAAGRQCPDMLLVTDKREKRITVIRIAADAPRKTGAPRGEHDGRLNNFMLVAIFKKPLGWVVYPGAVDGMDGKTGTEMANKTKNLDEFAARWTEAGGFGRIVGAALHIAWRGLA